MKLIFHMNKNRFKTKKPDSQDTTVATQVTHQEETSYFIWIGEFGS